MVRIIYWALLPKIVGFVSKSSAKCVNIGAGFFCGAAQAVGVEIYTKDSINQALNLKSAADACKDELPIDLTTEHDQVSEIMAEGGKTAVLKAKAIMRSSGINEKCIEIFSLVCGQAQASGALDIVKEACANLWV